MKSATLLVALAACDGWHGGDGFGVPGPTGPPVGTTEVRAFVRRAGEDCFRYQPVDLTSAYWAGWPERATCASSSLATWARRMGDGSCMVFPSLCSVRQANGNSSDEDPALSPACEAGDDCGCSFDAVWTLGQCPDVAAWDREDFSSCNPGWPYSDCET
jgi:hypothetical protein